MSNQLTCSECSHSGEKFLSKFRKFYADLVADQGIFYDMENVFEHVVKEHNIPVDDLKDQLKFVWYWGVTERLHVPAEVDDKNFNNFNCK